MATTIPLKELRNNVSDILRRAEGGEDFTITVSGRPVARLEGQRDSPWVPSDRLAGLIALGPDDTGWAAEREADRDLFDQELRDPWGIGARPVGHRE